MVPATEMFAETVERFIKLRLAGHCSREHQFAIRDEFSGVCRGGEKASGIRNAAVATVSRTPLYLSIRVISRNAFNPYIK